MCYTEPHWLVPFSRNNHFVGREQELHTLQKWSSSEDSCHRMAIFGLGGVGKTQVALEFAYRRRESDPDCSVFWIPATDQSAFEQAYLQIGQMLKIPGIDANGADVKQLVKDTMSKKSIGSWLMVIDNADDIDMVFRQPRGESGARALIDYIPFSLNGSILFTTRNRKAAVKQAAKNTIHVEMMDPDDAKKLLGKSLLRQEALADVEATEQLLNLLGFLPLAIIQAAAYINENDTTIIDYTDLYNDSEKEVMEILSEDFEDQGRYRAIENSIATTWLISLSQINRTNPLAIDYLSFMACLAHQNIPQSLLLPAPSKKQGIEAIGALTAYSFISKQGDRQMLDMHRLVHLATRNWIRNEKKLEMWTDRALSRLVDLLPAGGHENRATWTAYLPHAKYLLSSVKIAEDDGKIITLLENLGKCLYSNGRYSEAQQIHERALDLRIKSSGPENRETLRNMFSIAEALSHQGKYKEAEGLHRKILELRRKVLGEKDPEVMRSMNYLAQAMYYDGRYIEAEQMHREALSLQIEIFNPEHPNALTTTGYLAQTLSQQGKYEEAERMHRNLLKTRLKVSGEEYPATLATMSCLGVAQRNLGNYSDAERTHRRVLDLRVKVLGDRHPHTLVTKRWLADALHHQGKYEESYSLNRQVLELQTELLGPKHPNTILTLSNLGDTLFCQGQNDQAKELYQQVLDLEIELLGPEHPDTLTGMNNLANSLYNQGRHAEAKEIYEKVFDLRVKVLGAEHPKALSSSLLLRETFNTQVVSQTTSSAHFPLVHLSDVGSK
jgi:tetratricopeptide (TPR) repeat protein